MCARRYTNEATGFCYHLPALYMWSEEGVSFCTQSKKRSGVEGLIEIENPNRVSQKSKKVTEIDINAPKELSRRER